jgi:hypothetical protein
MTSKLVCSVVAALLATAVGRADDALYAVVGRVPASVANGSLNTFHYDPVGRRVYAPGRDGVYWVDVRSAEPRLDGPILFERPGFAEIAADTGRMYVANDAGFAYLNLRADEPPTWLTRDEWRGGRFVYERTRNEIYGTPRRMDDRVVVYDADTGASTAELTMPDSAASVLQAAPGKVFLKMPTIYGLHVIDAATRTVSLWLVDGQRVDPKRVHIEHSGRVMIAQYERYLAAIDIASARTIAQLPAIGLWGLAFDPDHRRVVVAIQDPPDHPRVHLRVYALGADGFTFLSELDNPAEDTGSLFSTADGFLQRTRHELVFWKARSVAQR